MTTWDQHPHLHGRIRRLYVEDDYLWCQVSNARDAAGSVCHWKDGKAAAFCLLGAVYKAYYGTQYWPVVSAYLSQIFNTGFWEGSLLTWNDTDGRSYEQVLEFLDKHKL